MYLHETRLAMLIDADAVPVAHHRPYRDIDIRYPWRSDEQRAADVDYCAGTEIPDEVKIQRRANEVLLAAERLHALQLAHIHAAERATRPTAMSVDCSRPDFLTRGFSPPNCRKRRSLSELMVSVEALEREVGIGC